MVTSEVQASGTAEQSKRVITGTQQVPEGGEVVPVGGVLLGLHLIHLPCLPIGYLLQVNMLVAPANQLAHARVDPL